MSVTFPRCTEKQMKDFKVTSAKLPLNRDSPIIYIDLRDDKFQTKQSAISQVSSVITPVNIEQEMSSTKRTTNTNAKANRQKR